MQCPDFGVNDEGMGLPFPLWAEFVTNTFQIASGTHAISYPGITRGCLHGVRQLKHHTKHSSPSRVEVKDVWN
jgi:hypothetical protein